MRRKHSAPDYPLVSVSDHTEKSFVALGQMEGADDSAFHRPRKNYRITGYLITCSALWCSVIIVSLSLIMILLSTTRGPEYDFDWIFSGWRKSMARLGIPIGHSLDFLHDVTPRPCHSHNDYWRKVPVYSALQAGCTGIEADVWLFKNDPELYVGHDREALTPHRTFRSLYVNPLVEILEKRNAETLFGHNNYSQNLVGVFETDPSQTLVLLVDIKTDGNKALDYVQDQLAPLRAGDWLTYMEDGVVHERPVTVVGSGRTPFDLLMQNSTYRDIFFDAPLNKFYEDPDLPDVRDDGDDVYVYNTTNSFYASVNFRREIGFVWSRLSEEQLRRIRGQIKGAHKRGLKVRYWNTPPWPISLRNSIWNSLEDAGADVLNVDDLEAGAKQLERHNKMH